MLTYTETIKEQDAAPDFKPEEKRAIFVPSLGTAFEWYDSICTRCWQR